MSTMQDSSSTVGGAGIRKTVSRLFRVREIGILAALVLLVLFFSLMSPRFLSANNLINIVRQVSLLGIIAMGMTMVIVSGEIDLSVGSVYGACAIMASIALTSGFSVIGAVLVGLATGLGFGVLNGVLATYGRVPSLIVTLGMMSTARGFALIVSRGRVITLNARNVEAAGLETFLSLGQGRILSFPIMSVIFLALFVMAFIVFNKSLLGFRMRAVGDSADASRAAGINEKTVKIVAFAITGALSAIAGMLNAAFLGNVQGTTGTTLELDVIGAVILGGTSLRGGEGTVIGTLIGVLIMGTLNNGIILMGISPFWQRFIIGIVIIAAVAIDMWTKQDTK